MTFSFVTNEPFGEFRCSLDGAGLTPCVSPLSLTGLKLGPHSFEVRATDAIGNLDATPAANGFRVVKKKKKRVKVAPDAVSRLGR